MSIPAPAAPPIASLPLPDPAAYPGEPREYAMALMQRKGDIEKAIVSVIVGVAGELKLITGCSQ